MGNRTGRIAVLGAWLTVGALCFASSAQAQKLIVSDASGDPGTSVTFTVTLSSGGTMVAGTQNDILFDPANIPVAAKANGKPNCVVNADIDKGATSFAFRPNGCTGAACTSMRALVLSTDNVTPIPDGSVLYTCTVNIAATASGTFPLTINGIILSDPNGNQIPNATGQNGSVTAGAPAPTFTPTVTGPTPTETPGEIACVAPAIQLPQIQGQAGVQASINATLAAGAAQVAGTQNDIPFAPPLSIAAKSTNGKPDCAVNGDIDKGATSFAFRPNGCGGTSGVTCTSVRALVLSTDNVAPIPDGSVLYTCKVNIASDAADGTYPLAVTGVILSDPEGNQIAGAHGCDGSVRIGIPMPGTPTPTPVVTPPTNTPTATATATQPPVTPPTNTPTATRTNTAKPTNTPTSNVPTPAPFDDDGGCNISTTGSSSAGWLVLVPAIGLLVMRRRRR